MSPRSRMRSMLLVVGAAMLSLALLAWATPASAVKPAPLPPTGRLVFGSIREWGTIPSSQLYAVNTDGTSLSKLTNFPWWAVFPTVSPDGTRIMFGGIQPEAHSMDSFYVNRFVGFKIFSEFGNKNIHTSAQKIVIFSPHI